MGRKLKLERISASSFRVKNGHKNRVFFNTWYPGSYESRSIEIEAINLYRKLDKVIDSIRSERED